MSGNIFAACMIVMLLGGIALIKVTGGRPTLKRSLIGALLAVVSFVLLVSFSPFHFCKAGMSVTPELLGAVLAGIVFAVVRDWRIKVASIVVFLLSGYALTYWSVSLVHQKDYTGNPNYSSSHRLSMYLKIAEQILSSESNLYPDLVLYEGWIEDSIDGGASGDYFDENYSFLSGTLGNYWHTSFTRLFRVEHKEMGVWSPGGPASECIGKLEIRKR